MSQRNGADVDAVYVWVSHAARARRATARQMLIHAGAMLLGQPTIAVGHDPNGRPWVRAQPSGALQVSVSHCRGVVAVAASVRWPVGVDVEHRRPPAVADIAHRWFDLAEVTWLRQQPDDRQVEAFLLLWTAKEASGKALGLGLRDSGLARLMPLPTPADAALRTVPGGTGLRVAHPPVRADAVLAVAVAGGTPDTTITVLEPETHGDAPRRIV